jgi:AGCS family alanine or glycine:cation symporter
MTLKLAWSMADLMMALLTMCNLVAIVLLSKQAIFLLNDYRAQKRRGIKSPVFTKDKMPEIEDKLVSW